MKRETERERGREIRYKDRNRGDTDIERDRKTGDRLVSVVRGINPPS
jgi:hypothetical protein